MGQAKGPTPATKPIVDDAMQEVTPTTNGDNYR